MNDAAGASAWSDASLAAALLAVDPVGLGGVSLRALHGPVRDLWLASLRSLFPPNAAFRRIPLNVGDDRLLGGLDLSATLHAGRPVAESGLLVEADGGMALLAMADCLTPSMAARLGAVFDNGEVAVERDGLGLRTSTRFGVVALDEGMADDERPPQALLDRLAFHVDLTAVGRRQGVAADASAHTYDDILAARSRLQSKNASPDHIEALCATAHALGIESMRPPLLALRAARALSALKGLNEVGPKEVTEAARLVFAPRARKLPAPADPDSNEKESDGGESERDASQNAAENQDDDPTANAGDLPLRDVVLAAVKASIPAGLLDQLRSSTLLNARRASTGRSGELQKSRSRGRPTGFTRGELRPGVRLNVIETLRAAAPWQRLRHRDLGSKRTSPRIQVRRDDFRITRFKQRTQTTTIFVVDASGSAALHRLAEAKGAVEMLLADSYVRRDRVALIAFRGPGAELLLPPTRSLVRAKRALTGLPGGGGTPLAAGIDAATTLARSLQGRGDTPIIVVLTDGRANVPRSGPSGREQAVQDSKSAASQLRAAGFAVVLIDTSPRPQAMAESLATEMNARYLPLPHADAAVLSRAVRAADPTRR